MIINTVYKTSTKLLKNVYYKQVSYGKFFQTYLRLPNWIYRLSHFIHYREIRSKRIRKTKPFEFLDQNKYIYQTQYIIRKDI